jgi:hypothetical protein
VGLKDGLDGSWMACVGSQTGYAMWPATLVYDVEGLLSLMPTNQFAHMLQLPRPDASGV